MTLDSLKIAEFRDFLRSEQPDTLKEGYVITSCATVLLVCENFKLILINSSLKFFVMF